MIYGTLKIIFTHNCIKNKMFFFLSLYLVELTSDKALSGIYIIQNKTLKSAVPASLSVLKYDLKINAPHKRKEKESHPVL